MLARINAIQFGKTGRSLGFINPLCKFWPYSLMLLFNLCVVYKMYALHPDAFIDITIGDNKVPALRSCLQHDEVLI